MLDRYDDNLILDYIEGELSDNDQAAFEKLLAEDDQMRTLVQRMVDDRDMLRTVPAVQAPSSVLASVNASLERDMLLGNEAPAGPFRFPVWARWATSMAAMLLLAAGLTWQLDPFGWNDNTEVGDPGNGDHLAINTKDQNTSGLGNGAVTPDTDKFTNDNQARRRAANRQQHSTSIVNALNTGSFSVELASADVQSTRRMLADWVEANDAVFVSAGEQLAMSNALNAKLNPSPEFKAYRDDSVDRRQPSTTAPSNAGLASAQKYQDARSANNTADSIAGDVAKTIEKKSAETLGKAEKLAAAPRSKGSVPDPATDPATDAAGGSAPPSPTASPAPTQASRSVKRGDGGHSPAGSSASGKASPADAKAENIDGQSTKNAGNKKRANKYDQQKATDGNPVLTQLAKRKTEAFKRLNKDSDARPLEGQAFAGSPDSFGSIEQEEGGPEASPAEEGETLAIAVPADRVEALLAHLNEKFGTDRVVIHQHTEELDAGPTDASNVETVETVQGHAPVPTRPAAPGVAPSKLEHVELASKSVGSKERSRDSIAGSPLPTPSPTAKPVATADGQSPARPIATPAPSAPGAPLVNKANTDTNSSTEDKVASKGKAGADDGASVSDDALKDSQADHVLPKANVKADDKEDAVQKQAATTAKSALAKPTANIRSNAKTKAKLAKQQQRVIISIIVTPATKTVGKTVGKAGNQSVGEPASTDTATLESTDSVEAPTKPEPTSKK